MEILKFIHTIKSFAESMPNKVMIVDGIAARKTTYSEFWTLSQKIASLIKKRLGENQRQLILIYMPDCMDYIAADTAIWMTGNAAVHVGVSFPKKRIDFIVTQTETPLIIDTDFIREALRCEPCAEIAPRTSDMPCTLFFTSGSVGNPKGILHSDASFMLNFRKFRDEYGISDYRSFLTIAPCYFVAVVFCFGVLENGQELHLPAKEIKMNVAELQDYIANHHIESAFLSPSLLQVYRNKAQSLKLVFTGSERLVGCYSDEYILLNTYGQTETATICISTKIDKNYDNSPIGKPLKGIEACILDKNGNEVSDGETGELCLKSGFIAPVYFKDPKKTAELTKGGVLHTGDLMKLLPNGDYLYIQRKDWMVKINGQRVEPGEIENAMKHIEGISNAVVKGFTTSDLTRQYLVGYYIVTPEAENVNDNYIIAELKKTLPAYMVPQYMVRMDKLPLNANLKIDRKSLKSPAVSPRQTEYVAPTNAVEKSLCEAFAKVLGLEQVGIDDDFFLLGGDSIRLMKLQQTLSTSVPTNVIFSARTPRRIAECVAETASNDVSHLQQEDYALSPIQTVFLNAALANPNSKASYFPVLLKYSKEIDAEKLCRALEAAVQAHPSLLMTIHEDKEKNRRIIPFKGKWTVSVEKMSDAEIEQEKKSIFKFFKFFDEPMFFARVIETESAIYLYHQMHHVVTDGVSNDIFRDDIAREYQGEKIEKETTTIYELNTRNEQRRKSKTFDECVQWFKKEFEGCPANKGKTAVGEMKTLKRDLSIPLHSFLDEICSHKNITLNVLLMSCAAYALGKINKQQDVRLATSFHGRLSHDILRTIGFVATPRSYRFHWNEQESVDGYLTRSKMHILGNMSRSIFTFRDIFTYMHIPPEPYMFIYQGMLSRPSLALDGVNGELLPMPVDAPPTLPLIIFVFDAGDEKFRITIDYDTDRYSSDFIERFATEFEFCLNKVNDVQFLNEL